MGLSRNVPPVKNNGNMYPSGQMSRLTQDWPSFPYSPDSEIRYNLRIVRARSRNLYATNDYAKHFVKMCSINVIGKDGITLRNKAADLKAKKEKDGTTSWNPVLDKHANRIIGEQWDKWQKKGICTIDGRQSFKDVQRMIIESIARDGEIIIRKMRVSKSINPFGFTLQILEVDHLDEYYTRIAPNGNQIIMGVEIDEYRKPTAYWLLKNHPGNTIPPITREYVRVPAEEIYHPYLMERPTQTRGLPWMYTAMTRLNNIGAYEEAAIMAARIGASAMGVFTSVDGEVKFGAKDPKTGQYKDGRDEKGNTVMEVEPGMFINAPTGTDFKEFNPKYPEGNYAPFMKATLRGVAAGLGVSYNSLASDLESVNYSSLRSGAIEERDAWKVIQDWFIENIMDQIFADWLDMALLSGAVSLPYAKYDKFNSPSWQARGFDWVDPLKDQQGDAAAIAAGFSTFSLICAKQGLDFEEVLQERAHEEELIKKYGVPITLGVATKQNIEESGSTPGSVQPPDTPGAPVAPAPAKTAPAPKQQDTHFHLTVNGAPVSITNEQPKNDITIEAAHPAQITINTPEMKIENTIQPASVTVNTPEMKVENHTTVEPSAPASVTVAPAEIKIENKIDVQPSPVPNVEVKLGDTKIENRFPRQAKKSMVMKDASGKIIRTVGEE